MAGIETGATLLKVGVTMIHRAAPGGIALLKSWFKGKEIMIVGQPRAGKTTFIDYLQYGLFEDEKETDKTRDVVRSARFNVKMGRDAALELTVKLVIDVPGQVGPVEHAKLVFERRPHAVIIFTDLTRSLRGESDRASAAWVQEFCRTLESRWRAGRKRTNRIKTIVLVMNKSDKADEKKVASCKQAFRKILDAELREARGQMLDEIAIMPCTLITNPEGTKTVDGIIAHLAKALAR
ncbi:MAG: GTPase domain-containing protein [Blastocatellia bacterium]